MTPTSKRVTRVTVREYPGKAGITGRGYGKARSIVITIDGDMLILRLKGTQQREYVPIHDAYLWAQRRRALSERAMKLNAKRRAK